MREMNPQIIEKYDLKECPVPDQLKALPIEEKFYLHKSGVIFTKPVPDPKPDNEDMVTLLRVGYKVATVAEEILLNDPAAEEIIVNGAWIVPKKDN